MGFMELEILRKGRLVSCDCSYCGATNYAHEWASDDFNEARDAMQSGLYQCDECGRQTVSSDTFWQSPSRNWYAARMSADGYLDCTRWEYGKNKRVLARDVRAD